VYAAYKSVVRNPEELSAVLYHAVLNGLEHK
jgi:hypothetical protein